MTGIFDVTSTTDSIVMASIWEYVTGTALLVDSVELGLTISSQPLVLGSLGSDETLLILVLVLVLALALQQRPVSVILLVGHGRELSNHKDPVQVVRKNGTVCGRVVPAQDGVEDGPAASAVKLRVTALPMSVQTTKRDSRLTLTCQMLRSMSYEPGPSPSSAASPPTTLFHCCCSNSQMAREKRPAATR